MNKQLVIEPKTVMGLSVGDLIITKDDARQYKTTPRRIAQISDPLRWHQNRLYGITIWPYPVFSIIVGREEWQINQPLRESQRGYINHIHRDKDRRYWDDCKWELFIVEKANEKPSQAGLFSQPVNEDPEPYPFQDGVEYIRFQTWHCDKCKTDFNAIREEIHAPYHSCGRISQHIMLMEQTPHNPYIEYLTRPTK